MIDEVWKDIAGYEGLYQVSNIGKIKALKPRYKDKEILKPSTTIYGYKVIWLYKDKSKKQYFIHRIVANAFIPNYYDKPHINHIDGDKSNNSVGNLEWVTPKENMVHAAQNGLSAGHKQNTSKLTHEQVLYIREKFDFNNKNYNSGALSKKFNVSRGNLLKVVYGETYKLDGGKIRMKGSR